MMKEDFLDVGEESPFVIDLYTQIYVSASVRAHVSLHVYIICSDIYYIVILSPFLLYLLSVLFFIFLVERVQLQVIH